MNYDDPDEVDAERRRLARQANEEASGETMSITYPKPHHEAGYTDWVHPARDRWDRHILTVGQLRHILEGVDPDLQVVFGNREFWYDNVSHVAVPVMPDPEGENAHAAVTLYVGEEYDPRQL